MSRAIGSEHMKPVNVFAEVLEDKAMEQFNNAMAQDFVVAGALMPDAHTGYSLPIGAAVSTRDVVVPAWVGYDIGCGMCALRLEGISAEQVRENSKQIFDMIYERIPVGAKVNTTGVQYSLDGLTPKGAEIAKGKRYERVLGSLGGGNHFIEVGADDEGYVWVVIHSGSRGVGHGIAAHYMTIAAHDMTAFATEFDEKNKSFLENAPEKYDKYKQSFITRAQGKLKPREGHFGLGVNSEAGKDYIQDQNWCLDYALANRREMMERVVGCIADVIKQADYEADFSELINRNHNHAVEREGVWIHRKGATHAEEGMLGVIPANMRDGSFIVRGKGNPDALFSSSHGAGRVLGRKAAKEALCVDGFIEDMQGIQALVGEQTLDESPKAYKNIFEVMDQQKKLVEVVTRIKPIINIKG